MKRFQKSSDIKSKINFELMRQAPIILIELHQS